LISIWAEAAACALRRFVADPSKVRVPTAELLSKDYAAKRRSLFNPKKGERPSVWNPH
jgi:gamma-glutamyltranspeptidase